MGVLLAILGLGLLMVIHEGGHFLIARLFGMKVIKFSIGFGPVIYSKKPKGSATTYQIAVLPFLAYVQIAGMNPHEENDPHDKESYANASWLGRFLTILAGPVANYLAAVVAVFFLLVLSGDVVGNDGLKIGTVVDKTPAAQADVHKGDEVQSIGGKPVKDWDEMKKEIQAHKGQETDFVVVRDGQPVTLKITPSSEGRIGIIAKELRQRVSVYEAAKRSIINPPRVAVEMVKGLAQLLTFKIKPELKGPVGIVDEANSQIKQGPEAGVGFFVILSIYIFVFNLLPFPALDGGRLAFLLYELISRRRPDAKVEARVHMIGLLTLLAIFVPLFFKEIYEQVGKLFLKG